ncbi:MAG: GxxExxY protein [Bacteroidia bacterium]
MSATILKRDDLVYPELSFKLVGYAFEVFNELGYGHHEKHYQKAFAILLKQNNHIFEEQKYYNLKFKGEIIGKSFLDFEIEDKVVVELKKDALFSNKRIEQVLEYLKESEKKLAILISFSSQGVKSKRLINFDAIKNDSDNLIR